MAAFRATAASASLERVTLAPHVPHRYAPFDVTRV